MRDTLPGSSGVDEGRPTGRGPTVRSDLGRVADAALRATGAQASVVVVVADGGHVVLRPGPTPSAPPGSAVDTVCAEVVATGATVSREATDDNGPATYLAAPLLTAHGQALGALCVYDGAERVWHDHEQALLEDLARWAAVELELGHALAAAEGDRVAWRLAVDAAGVGAFEWDLTTGELRWDDRLLELFGHDSHSFDGTIDSFNTRVHPEDLPRVTEALETAIATCGEYAAEYRIRLPNGATRWIAARGRALADHPGGPAVQLLGAASDTTAVQEGETRVSRILESMPTAFFQLDADFRFSYLNGEAERLLGMSRAQMVGESLWDLFPAADETEFGVHYRRAVETGEPVAFDAYYPAPLDSWYEVRAWPSPDGLSVYFVDVSARYAAQRELDAAARRDALLARVTETLTGTLDPTEGVSRLTGLLVPALADWCLVTLVDDAAASDWRLGLRDLGWEHRDPEQRELLDRYASLRLAAMTDASYLAKVITTRQPIYHPTGAVDRVADVLVPGEAQDLVRRLDPSSMLVLPLRGRDRTVGVVSAFRARRRPAFSEGDRALLQDIGSRAGLALDNARLYAEQRDVAAALQRNLLTAPPQPHPLQIAVRYAPAGKAAQVGGDWYDAFLQPSEAGRGPDTVVVVGDVVGHDLEAAGAMGQVRGLLRGVAAHSGASPADVIAGVDRAMETLRVETTATVVVARLEPDAARGEAVCWSNAGHPPPLLVDGAGEVTVLAGPTGNDLLLGLDPGTARTEHRTRLEPGGTLLLYTDGLVERRGSLIDEGIDALRAHLAELARAGLPLEELCDALLARMVPRHAEDDVALLAVRLAAYDG